MGRCSSRLLEGEPGLLPLKMEVVGGADREATASRLGLEALDSGLGPEDLSTSLFIIGLQLTTYVKTLFSTGLHLSTSKAHFRHTF